MSKDGRARSSPAAPAGGSPPSGGTPEAAAAAEAAAARAANPTAFDYAAQGLLARVRTHEQALRTHTGENHAGDLPAQARQAARPVRMTEAQRERPERALLYSGVNHFNQALAEPEVLTRIARIDPAAATSYAHKYIRKGSSSRYQRP